MWRTLLACITTSILTAYCVTHLQAEQALAWLPAANSAAAAAAAFATGGISTPGWPLEGEFSLRRLRALKGNSSSSLEHHDSESLDGGSSSSSSSSRELLYQGGGFSPTWRRQHGAFKSRWHGTVLRSVFKAQSKVRSTKEQRASRIFVPLLSNRHEQLCCMLTDLNAKVGATNALDVWVFSVDHEAETVYNKSPCWRRKFNITVAFMVLDEHWTLDPRHSSSAVHDRNAWVGLPGLFGEDYRRMGHWRLAFQPAFADMLGYKLLWQLDDDSFFTSPLNISMADHMRQQTCGSRAPRRCATPTWCPGAWPRWHACSWSLSAWSRRARCSPTTRSRRAWRACTLCEAPQAAPGARRWRATRAAGLGPSSTATTW
jgi:hypothetical protein